MGLGGLTAPVHVPTDTERDSALFGVHVVAHDGAVPTRVLTHPPALADAGVDAGTAVPVERYFLDGDLLTLLVSHDVTCVPAVVLLAPDGGVLDVTVVYVPSRLTPSASPGGDACQAPDRQIFVVHSTVGVVLSPGLPTARIRDAGGHGEAGPVSPSPGR